MDDFETLKTKLKETQTVEKRDQLAIDRTVLANQRTFLAFIRTALMVLVSGITLIKLFNTDPFLVAVGWLLLPVALITFAIGLVLFLKMKHNISGHQH